MKQLLVILFSMAIGAASYWAFSPHFIETQANDPRSTIGVTDTATDARSTPDDTTETDPSADPDRVVATPPPPNPDLPGQTFPIIDTADHPAAGWIRIINTPEERIVRYETYDGTNGPDLHVYLANDLDATDYVDLGPARGNAGNINYSVPPDVDLADYQYVLTWSEAEDELHNYAEIY